MLIFQGVYRSEFVDGDGHSQVGWIYFFSGPWETPPNTIMGVAIAIDPFQVAYDEWISSMESMVLMTKKKHHHNSDINKNFNQIDESKSSWNRWHYLGCA